MLLVFVIAGITVFTLTIMSIRPAMEAGQYSFASALDHFSSDQIHLENHTCIASSAKGDKPSRFFVGCSTNHCGRFVVDDLVTPKEAAMLRNLADTLLNATGGGGTGPVSIVDLQSGAVSYRDQFVHIYKLYQALTESGQSPPAISQRALSLLKDVKDRIQQLAENTFGVSMYFTRPTFFSRIVGGVEPKIRNDEYWHPHVDRIQYPAFEYTGLLYLNDYGTDFQGGRFMFIDNKGYTNRTIEPKAGRISVFTSGAENTHMVEKVSGNGVRYALTLSFTCDPAYAASVMGDQFAPVNMKP